MKHVTLVLLLLIGTAHAANLYDTLDVRPFWCDHTAEPPCIYEAREPGGVLTFSAVYGSIRLMHMRTSDGYAAEEGLTGGCARIFRTSRPEDDVYISPKTYNKYRSLKECAEAKEW